ncbi:hypothetical protein GCM10019016_016320 [Streptomyces prasinosporus]|uniref:Uncharacterized protein n=1 Tax=Streptomyces prasinosporus TaxID=68256 RepID=A0ABP6TJ90_9ACTN
MRNAGEECRGCWTWWALGRVETAHARLRTCEGAAGAYIPIATKWAGGRVVVAGWACRGDLFWVHWRGSAWGARAIGRLSLLGSVRRT